MQTTHKQTEPSPSPCSAEWTAVPPDRLPGEWHVYAPLVRRALLAADGTHNERDVLLILLSGRWQMYTVVDRWVRAICMVEVVDFPRCRKLLVHYAAGEGELFADAVPQLEALAKLHHCDIIEAYSRKGWTRKLPGWKQLYVIMQKEV